MLAQKSPQMKTPVEKLLEINHDSHARTLFEAREKQRRDNVALQRRAKQEGKLEGRLEGKLEGKLEEKIETARRMLKKNMAIEDIADITGFTHEYVKSL